MRDQYGLEEDKTNSQKMADFNIVGYRKRRMISDDNENKKLQQEPPG